MKYGIVSTTPFPFIVPVLPKPTFLDGKLLTTFLEYPKEKETVYPLQITWRYRLSNRGQHLFSYIAESKFIIENDGIPVNMNELDKFIGDLYLNVEIGWENNTRNTPLFGQTMPALIRENLNAVREQILGMLK